MLCTQKSNKAVNSYTGFYVDKKKKPAVTCIELNYKENWKGEGLNYLNIATLNLG